tara:strand:+ start:1420 stop:1776 length:357 start_codon:yes stop_codon:yes gene_type:complete
MKPVTKSEIMFNPEITEGNWFMGKEIPCSISGNPTISIGHFEADCHYEDTMCEIWSDNIAEYKENAEAIIAVPELLKVYKAAKEYMSIHESEDNERRAGNLAKSIKKLEDMHCNETSN